MKLENSDHNQPQRILPKRIILVRHGESQGNTDDTSYATTPDNKIPLTSLGIKQANQAGSLIKKLISENGKAYFYVSPYERTRSTLREIGREFPKKRVIGVREECRVREQDFGNFQITERMKVIKETRERFGRFFYRFPEGESAADVYDRVSSFLESLWRDIDMNRLQHDSTNELNLVIVSHGLALRVFLMKWFKWTVEQFEYLNNFGNCEVRVMQLGVGGDYSLALNHTNEEMLEWGLSQEMISDQRWRARASKDDWNEKCLDSFFDQFADSDSEDGDDKLELQDRYSSSLSLNFTIDQIPRSIIPDKYQIEPLKEKITYLLRFFEHHYENEDLAYERAVVDDAYAVDFFVEWHALCKMLIESGYTEENNLEAFPEDQIRSVLQEFESIKDYAMQITDYKATHDESQGSKSHPASSGSSFSNTMVGFNEHLNWIMDVITRPGSAQLQILPVTGMAGIGKTTLVRNVFDNKVIRDHFDIRLWGEVSQSCKAGDVLLCFLRDLGITTGQKTNNELWEKVYKALVHRRYLLVIDDIWSIEVWDSIRRFFPNDGRGSRIIITTRLLEIASHIGSRECGSYNLELLNDDESWKLLEGKVFARSDCPSALENIGKKIAKN